MLFLEDYTRALRGTVFLNPHPPATVTCVSPLPPAPADFLSKACENVHK